MKQLFFNTLVGQFEFRLVIDSQVFSDFLFKIAALKTQLAGGFIADNTNGVC